MDLTKQDLEKAYQKAGNAFKGQMAHIFVMLFDDDDDDTSDEDTNVEEEQLNPPGKKDSRKRRAGTEEPNGTPVKKQNANTMNK